MSVEPARPGPIDCLRRGLLSLRANWELVPVLLAQSLLTMGLMLAGFLILLTALGVSVVAWVRDLGPGWQHQLAEDLVAIGEATPPALLPLVAPLIAATLVWTVAFGLYCYLQGGVVGVLAEGEMVAGAGLPTWRSFRRFSVAAFDLQARRLFWPYFWFNHLLGAVALGWMVLVVGLVALAVRLASGPNAAVGVGIGCAGLVPLGLLLFAVALWSMLATVEVARPQTGAGTGAGAGAWAGVWAAGRRALGTLRRRLGPVLVIWLLTLAAWLVVGAAFAPLRWAVAIATRDQVSLWLGGRGALLVAETLVDSALIVALIATLAALVGLRPAVEAGSAVGTEAE